MLELDYSNPQFKASVGELYARDYYQCVTADGLLVLLYRDALAGQWYLHGWWD